LNDRRDETGSGPEGLEPPQQNRRKPDHSDLGGAEFGALPDLSPKITPELVGLIDAWDSLPEPVRRGVLAMVEAANTSK
jgi:hypothetical protein